MNNKILTLGGVNGRARFFYIERLFDGGTTKAYLAKPACRNPALLGDARNDGGASRSAEDAGVSVPRAEGLT
jgi:hypothetical protein